MANELIEPPPAPSAQQSSQDNFPDPSADDISKTISSAMSESDRKLLDTPEKPEKKKASEKAAKKLEIGDSEIPLDDEPEKVVEEGEEEEDEQPPEAKTETDRAKSDAKWKQYREAYRENSKLKSENQTLKEQLAKQGDQTELNTLRQHVQALANERQRLMGLVEQGNIEQSEIWEQQVKMPLNQMWEDIQTIAKRNGMDQNQLARLLQDGDDKLLNDYMEEHETRPGDRHYLFGMIRDIQRIDRHKQYLRANASELSQRSRQEFMARRDHYFQDLGQQRSSAVQQIAPKIEAKILSILPKDKRRNLQGDIQHILAFDKWKPDVQMYAGLSAVVLPDLLDSYNLLRSQLKEAKTELIKFRGGSPKITTGGKAPARPALEDSEEQKPESLAKLSLTDFAEQSGKRVRQAFGYRK